MFGATSAHHQEFSLLYMQSPVICVAACPWHCLLVILLNCTHIKIRSTFKLNILYEHGSKGTGFSWNLVTKILRKICQETPYLFKIRWKYLLRHMFILLTALRNILQLYNTAKGTRSCISMVTLNVLMLIGAVHIGQQHKKTMHCSFSMASMVTRTRYVFK
jgi:hypothetical protein